MIEEHGLGPNQLAWLREKFGHFAIIEQQTIAAKEDSRRYRDKYLIHERKIDIDNYANNSLH